MEKEAEIRTRMREAIDQEISQKQLEIEQDMKQNFELLVDYQTFNQETQNIKKEIL